MMVKALQPSVPDLTISEELYFKTTRLLFIKGTHLYLIKMYLYTLKGSQKYDHTNIILIIIKCEFVSIS